MKKRIFTVLLTVCLLLAGTGRIYSNAVETNDTKQADPLQLHARSAVLMDADSGRVLYGKDAGRQMPMASTTKIMTCILALEYGNLNDEVTASAYAARQPKVHLGVQPGLKFRLSDLLHSLMLESHNDSAVMIAESVGGTVEGFAKLMNQKARDIGCYDTWFVTPNGLDATSTVETSAGKKEQKVHSTTAADLARIMRYCIQESPKKQEFLKITRAQSFSFKDLEGKRSYSCNNHNAFLGMMEGALSGKTGFTGNAGYCYVGALKRGDRTFIVTLLACGWPNNKTYKWADTRKLMTYGLENYEYREIKVGDEAGIFRAEDALKPVEVKGGVPKSGNLKERSCVNIKLKAKKDEKLRVLMKKDEEITASFEGKKELKAAVEKGDPVGTVQYRLNGNVIASYPVVADGRITKLNYEWCFHKIWKLFTV